MSLIILLKKKLYKNSEKHFSVMIDILMIVQLREG